jgi:protein involved in polysaccharide export with SLBB domain
MRNRNLHENRYSRGSVVILGVLLSLSLVACGGSRRMLDGGVAMVDEEVVGFAPKDSVHVDSAYRLSPGDEIRIDFLFDRTLDTIIMVRPDGGINLPILGDLIVAGTTPGDLALRMSQAYGRYYTNPQLSINLARVAPPQVYVLGEVTYPKAVVIRPGMTVLGAIAEAGGQTQFGNLGSVVLIRRTGIAQAVARRFDAGKFARGEGATSDLFLQDYDIVYVPKSFIGKLAQTVDLVFNRLTLIPVLYLRGWEAFNTERVYGRATTPNNTQQQSASSRETP